MPKLLLLAACEKAIIDQATQGLSVIGVILEVTVHEALPIPAGAAVPRPWAVATIWAREPGDEDRSYETQISMRLPNGNVAIEATAKLDLSKTVHRGIFNINAFPIEPAGTLMLTLSFREIGASEWAVAGEFPVQIKHGPVAEQQPG